eukprot:6172300-Pleurochrysis_carterae.AAC.2
MVYEHMPAPSRVPPASTPRAMASPAAVHEFKPPAHHPQRGRRTREWRTRLRLRDTPRVETTTEAS